MNALHIAVLRIHIYAYCTSMHSYICIVASHLGSLDEPREGRDDGAKPEDGVGGLIREMEVTSKH
jgi:hypothetical protein